MADNSFNPLEHGATPVSTQGTGASSIFDPLALGAVPVGASSASQQASPSSDFDPTALGAKPVASATPVQTGSDQEPSDPNEGLLGKAWDWLNKPLAKVDLRREGAGEIESGIEGGLSDVISGLTSPLSLGLTVATAGAGGLLESMGVKLSEMAAPEVISAAKTVSKLTAAGFSAQQLYGIAQETPEFVQAVKNGDTQKAVEIGTESLLQGSMALLGAHHAIGDMVGAQGKPATVVDELRGYHLGRLKVDTDQAKDFELEFKKAVPSIDQRNAIQFYSEAGGDQAKLQDWSSRVSEAKDLKPKLRDQLLDSLDRAQKLNPDDSPAEMHWVGRLREFYNNDWVRATDAEAMSTDQKVTNFVARAPWEEGPKDQENLDEAKQMLGQSGRMDHTQQRIFESTVDGILARDKEGKLLGFAPKKIGGRYVFDAAHLAADYHVSIGRQIALKQFTQDLKDMRADDGRPGAVPGGSVAPFDTKPELDEEGNEVSTPRNLTMLNSNGIADHPLTRGEVRVLRKRGLLAKMIADGRIKDLGEKAESAQPADEEDEPATVGSANQTKANATVEPIRAFHGSPAQFEGAPRTDGLGAHFTLSKDLAQRFADDQGEGKGRVVEANLNIRNPLRVEDHGGSHTSAFSTLPNLVKQGALPEQFDTELLAERLQHRHEQLLREGMGNDEAYTLSQNEELEKAKSYLESQGYDGLVYENKAEGHGDSYVAFRPEQITDPSESNVAPAFNKEAGAAGAEGEHPSNGVGELVHDAKGPILRITPEAIAQIGHYMGAPDSVKVNGASMNRADFRYVADKLSREIQSGKIRPQFADKANALLDIVNQAKAAMQKGGAVFLEASQPMEGKVAGEEFGHRWQTLWSDKGNVESHLDEKAFNRLFQAIPDAAHSYLMHNQYDPATENLVIETAAKFMADMHEEMGVSPEEAAKFLNKYFDEVVDKHGEAALESIDHAIGHARDVLDERLKNRDEYKQAKLSDKGQDEGVPGRASEGRRKGNTGPPEREKGNANQSREYEADGRTYEESEHLPGEELPIGRLTAEDPEEKFNQLPEALKDRFDEFRKQAADYEKLKSAATADDAEKVQAARDELLDAREELEEQVKGVKRFPAGVRKAVNEFIKTAAPTPDEDAEAAYYRGRYRYNTEGYDNSIRHRYLTGSVYGGSEDTFLRAPLGIHPQFAPLTRQIFNPEKSWLERNPVTSRVLAISNAAKHTLLSASGFHWVQEGLKGLETGLGPSTIFNPPKVDLINNVDQMRMVQAGGLMPGIAGGADAFAEGIKGAGLTSHIPGVGPLLDSLNKKLFDPNGYIDRLKMAGALKFDERLKQMYPNLDERTRLKVAGEMANNRFGGQNYLALGLSSTARDLMRLTLLAPDWFLSQARDAGALVGPFAKLRGQDLGRIALYNFVVAQTLNKINTGRFHFDTPFGVQSQDGKKVYSVRTMPQDLFHAVTDFRDYSANRLNPIISRTAVEAITGRDKQGKLRDMGEQLKDLLSNVIPIPAQGIVNKLTGNAQPNESVADSARSALGLTTKTNPTPAEQLAYRLASENQSTGHVPSEQVAKFHSIINLENRLRDGDQSALEDMRSQYLQGKLAPHDVQSILKGAKTTRLASIINRLPMSNALDVWNLTTNDEREKVAPIMLKKMVSFQKTERQNLTPAERGRIDTRLALVLNQLEQGPKTNNNE
jgi:hypothetical protein